MVNDITLTPADYAVLSRVPVEWWDEYDTVFSIAVAVGEGVGVTRRRIAHLLELRLVERRKRNTIAPATEIRRIGK